MHEIDAIDAHGWLCSCGERFTREGFKLHLFAIELAKLGGEAKASDKPGYRVRPHRSTEYLRRNLKRAASPNGWQSPTDEIDRRLDRGLHEADVAAQLAVPVRVIRRRAGERVAWASVHH